jgi:hypothetical protein
MTFQVADLTLFHRLLLIALSILTWGVMFKCIYHLYRLFGNYSRGEIFTRGSVSQLRQWGIACLLWGVMNVLWLGLWIATSANVPSSLQIHNDSFAIGIIIIVIAWFMDMAVDLREENELTI